VGDSLLQQPPFRGPRDEALTRIVETVRSILDPDAVEIEVHFRPQALRYRRRFLAHRVSAARPVHGPSRPHDPARRLEVRFRCARRRLAALAPDGVRPRLMAAGLSEREAEVVSAILRGLRNAEIARELFITEWTVKDHLKHVFQKLGVTSRGALVRALWDETLVSRGAPC